MSGITTARSFVCCLVALLLAWGSGSKVEAATVFGSAQGMPSNLVQAITVDDEGFVWVATQDGLSSFDGHRFEHVFLSAPGVAPDEHAREMLIIGRSLLVATATRLVRVDLKTRSVQEVQSGTGSLVDVQAMHMEPDGEVWLGTGKGQLWRIPAGDDRPRQVVIPDALVLPAISAISGDREQLWLATANGLFEVERDGYKTRRYEPSVPGLVITDPYVSDVHVDARGRLWIGYWNDGLVRIDPASGASRWFHPVRSGHDYLKSSSILAFAESGNRLYIGTNRGLVRTDEDCDCLRPISHPEWDKTDGNGVVVTDLAFDESGTWTAIWGRGLVRFSAGDEFFDRLVPVDERADSLAHPMVYSLLVDRQDRLWAGTYGGFVQSVPKSARIDDELWPMDSVPRKDLRTESRFVWTMAEQGDRILIGTGYGLFAVKSGQVEAIDPALQSIRSFLVESDGSALIGAVRGLFRLRDGQVSRVPLPDGLPSNFIWSMLRRGEELWLGTTQGLVRLDAAGRLIEHHAVGMGAADMPGAVVWTQKVGPDGRVWLGTSGGLVEVEGQQAPFRMLRHPAVMTRATRSVGAIEFNGPDELWLATPTGLVQYRPGDRLVRRFDRRDGLISDQLHNNSSTTDGKRLYFGGAGGFIAFDPANPPTRTVTLRPGIVRMKIGEQGWGPPQAVLDLPDDVPSLQLQLSAFHFEKPERVRFSYRWAPEELEFSELGDAHQAVFSDLQSGERILQLRAELDGQSVERDVLTLRVAHAWHETWVGRFLLVLSLVALAGGVFAWRVRAIRANADELRKQVALRTRDLRAAKSELEAANARLRERVETDSLTGLRSRHAALEKIREWHGEGKSLGLLLIDLDHFKQINDVHGHLVGDAVLTDFAKVMVEALPEFVCARYGGEEFLAFRQISDPQLLLERAHQLQASVHRQVVTNDHGEPVRYTVSIGAAVTARGESINTLIRRADAAMYRAKAAGRDQIIAG